MSNELYAYVHRRASDNKVFYVGKGKGNRCSVAHRNPHWRNVAKKHGWVVQIVDAGLTEAEAWELECALIDLCGRETLTNKTDGGEGQANPSQETRDKISRGNKGKVLSVEARAKISEKHKGKPKSEEAKARMSLAAMGNKKGLGKVKSAELRQKLSEVRMGMKFSAEHRKSLSEARKRAWANPEFKIKRAALLAASRKKK
jgi:hypothetical protein